MAINTWALQRTYKAMTADEPVRAVWFKDKPYDEPTQAKALAGVAKWLQQEYGDKAALKKTPAGTGMGILELCLPVTKEKTPMNYPALPDGIQRLLHATAFPFRWQDFDKKAPGVEYDGRSAFVGCCRYVPSFFGELVHDDKDEFVPYRPARYLCEVTVPRNWDKIGLVPAEHVDGQRYRAYPNTPGQSWQVWLDGAEVDLLEQERWPYHIKKRLLFAEMKAPGADPLRKWIEPIIAMLEKIETHPRFADDDIKAIRHCIRAIALQTIGRFHYTGGEDVMEIDGDTGELSVTVAPKLNAYTQRFHHPEWSAAIWAKNRVHVTRQALKMRPEQILRIHGDSLVLTVDPGWEDDGKVRTYRKKVA